jgi:hypothetical protein
MSDPHDTQLPAPPEPSRRVLRGALVLVAVFAASLSFLLALTQAGSAVQGAPNARWLAALLAVGGAVALWGAVWAAASRNPFGRWRPRGDAPYAAPRRLIAARVALVIAFVITLVMMTGLPYRAMTRQELAAFAALTIVAIASLGGAILVTRISPMGRALVVALGIYSSVMAIWRLPSMLPVLGSDAGPGPVVLLLIVGLVWASHIFAALCVVSLRGAWPPRTV